MRYRRYGAENFIEESIDGGEGNNRIMIKAKCLNPVEMGLDPKLIDIPENGTLITAVSTMPMGYDSLNIYHFRPAFRGVEMRIRTYHGIGLKDGKFIRNTNGVKITYENCVMTSYHCLLEYPHLGRFLPSLYAEEGGKPVWEY
jgi:hypothetical protein